MNEFFVKSANASIRYHDLPGDKLPILFIHGLGCTSSFDYPQVAGEHNLDNHRKILVDLLGSGFSDKPSGFDYTMESHASYLLDLLNHLNIDKFHLFGHSMGGSIAISLASKCPAKLASLLVAEANLDSGGGVFSLEIVSCGMDTYINRGHDALIRSAIRQANGKWAAGLKASLPEAVYKDAESLVKGVDPKWRDILFGLDVPRTFIFGGRSLPDPDQDDLEENNIHIEIVPKAGHSIAWENPSGLALAIANGIKLAE